MVKRSKIDIIVDILNCINAKEGKIKPTHLMYKSNLSHIQMKGYISELLDKNFIQEEFNEKKKMIAITKRGKDFLTKILQMKAFQDTFGL